MPTRGDPERVAVDATRRFLRFYHHAAPFNVAVLEELWDRCAQSPSRASCEESRSDVESLLGTRIAGELRTR